MTKAQKIRRNQIRSFHRDIYEKYLLISDEIERQSEIDDTRKSKWDGILDSMIVELLEMDGFRIEYDSFNTEYETLYFTIICW